MDSIKKVKKTPKSSHKLKSPRSSRRDTPEGISISEKPVPKLSLKTPSPKKKTRQSKRQNNDGLVVSPASHSPAIPSSKKKAKKHKLLADEKYGDHNLLNDSLSSQGSKRSRLSESEYDVDASITDQSSLHLSPPARQPASAKKTSKKSPKKKSGSSQSLGNKTDVSWERAVQTARGLPDGALGDGEEGDVGPSKEQTQTPEAKPKSKEKKAKFEKGKKKPFDLLQNTAKKLKKIAGKQTGTKRKHEGSEKGDAKKAKLEEASKKDRKKQRKMAKTNYEVAARAKSIWNQLRQINLPVEKRKELSDELYELIKGRAKQLIYAHDTSRVIQCLMKFGLQEHKNALFEELREDIAEMTKSKYGKFFVRKLLKYGTKAQRNYVFRKLHGNVAKLIRHKEASEIIECAYNDYANASQRASLVEEFYGPSFALFKTGEVRTLDQVMKSHPDKREAILRNMKEALSGLMEKTVLQHSIVHRVFFEFFTYASPKLRTEMIETVREGVVEMLHTRDGARVAMTCLWYGTAKDRKVIIKSFKSFVAKICKEEYGHLVMLALFDVVDDTKLVQKAILAEMLKSVSDLALDQYGRKVLLYLLAPRDPIHFHPDIVKVLQEGDDNPTSKKEAAVRRQELLEFISRPLIQYIVKNCREIVLNNSALLLMLSILTHAKCDPTDAMRAVSEIAAEPFSIGSDPESFHIVEHTAGHLTLKKLIQNDATRIQAKEEVLFSSILLDVLGTGSLKAWAACNRGCFILVNLLELKHEEITQRVKKELAGIKKSLKKMEFKGAQVLLSKLL